MSLLFPTTEAELVDVVSDAHAMSTPLRIVGGNTRNDLGGRSTATTELSTQGLSGVTLYEPGALTLIAKAGTPLADIQTVLRAENQILPFEPMDHRTILGSAGAPTIGSVASLNMSGPRRIKAGACRDSVIGVRLVDGTGSVIKSGGRVMKNVTGLDVAKLVCGSYGSLGVVSEVALKLLPAPEASATLVLHGLDWVTALDEMSRALRTPYEVSGASADAAGVYLRVEGLAGQVAYRMDKLSDIFKRYEQTQLTGQAHDDHWVSVRDVTALTNMERPLWRISTRPSDAHHIVKFLGADADVMLDWGGGLIWGQSDTLPDSLRLAVDKVGGHAMLVRHPAPDYPCTPLHPEVPRLAAISTALRQKFDPSGILNTGKLAA